MVALTIEIEETLEQSELFDVQFIEDFKEGSYIEAELEAMRVLSGSIKRARR